MTLNITSSDIGFFNSNGVDMKKLFSLILLLISCTYGITSSAYGAEWIEMDSGTTHYLYDVWGSSATDVFAVGGGGTISHYDGINWIPMDSGINDSLSGVWLSGVWGSSASDVFAVGGHCDGFAYHSIILHYDGLTWSQVESGITGRLKDVWGSSGTDVFAVGDGGAILHYNGQTWSFMKSGTTNELENVWGTSSADVFTVGWNGTILHYNGNTWTPMRKPINYFFYSGIWGASGFNVYTVGGLFSRGPDNPYRIEHYNGLIWTLMTVGVTDYLYLYGIWGGSGTDIFSVGDHGTILQYDGYSWETMSSGTTKDLQSVWGSSATDVFAVGSYGAILHYDGDDTNTCAVERIFGEYSEETELLRSFRDDVLKQTPEGQELIKLYYQWSPSVVKAMGEDEGFKEGVKEMIDGIMPMFMAEGE